jgi:hypothetical protein
MGLAKTGLEKWDEARGFLELAVQSQPDRPEPKTRLGLVYAKFNRMDDARRQREALGNLSLSCTETCPDRTWIMDGLRTLDQALASAEAASRISANALASVSIAPAGTKDFDPRDYSLVTFSDPHALYDLLTQPGRCEPGKAAAPREPCALILYQPVEDTADTLAANADQGGLFDFGDSHAASTNEPDLVPWLSRRSEISIRRALPPKSRPLSCSITASASLASSTLAKPKPRQPPVSRSFTALKRTPAPTLSNRASSSLASKDCGRLPT